MTSVYVLAAAWVVVGIPAIIAILRERRSPDRHFARAMDALGPQPNAPTLRLRVSLTRRRAQVTAGTYLSGAVLLSLGLVLRSPGVLAGAVVLANLGTVYRISVLRMRAVAAQRQAPAVYVLPPAPPEPSMIAILGPVSERIDAPRVDDPVEPALDDRAVLIG